MHHDQPRFPFFIYLYVGWILFLDLDLVSSREEKKETIFQDVAFNISRNNETFRNNSPARFSPLQRFFKVQRIWQKYRRLPIVPFLWFPVPISGTNAFSVVQDNSSLYYIDQRNGFTLSPTHVSTPDVLSLKFPLNITSLKEREQFQWYKHWKVQSLIRYYP